MDCNLFKFCLIVNGVSLDYGVSNFIMCYKKLYDLCIYILNLLLYFENFNFFFKNDMLIFVIEDIYYFF